MPNNRDDFTDTVKRTAALRVGYRCSFKGCGKPTTAASEESSGSVSNIGIAAHICAAAEGGPRYDSNMTPEERKSVDNCIWMCQNHAHLIDTDEKTYTVEKLKGWKREAEELAIRSISDVNYIDSYQREHGKDVSGLESIFDRFIIDGSYDALHSTLEQFNVNLPTEYQELVLRYSIIYDVYCCRSMLDEHLRKYVSLSEHPGIDMIVQLFIQFELKEELKIVIPLCHDDELILFTKMSVEKGLYAFFTNDETEPIDILKYEHQELINKYLSCRMLLDGIEIHFTDGTLYNLYDKEFYYKVIAASYRISLSIFKNNSGFPESTIHDDVAYLKDNINRIRQLDKEQQLQIIPALLNGVLHDVEAYATIKKVLSDEINSEERIVALNYVFLMCNDFDSIEFKELEEFSLKTSQYQILLMYIDRLPKDKRKEYFEDRKFLFEKDICFINAWYATDPDYFESNAGAVIEKYKELYADSFLYHCLRFIVTEDKDELSWLSSHKELMLHRDINCYINILYEQCLWDELYALKPLIKRAYQLFKWANCISSSEKEEHTDECIKTYQELIDSNNIFPNLYYNMAASCYYKGLIEKAKEYMKLEYDKYKNKNVFLPLLRMRLSTSDFIEDEVFDDAKKYINFESQNLIGAIYMSQGKAEEAERFFIRSVLLQENTESLTALFSIYNERHKTHPAKQFDKIAEGCICTLKNDTFELKVAIHKRNVIDGIIGSTSLNCFHYSTDDRTVSNIMFKHVNDTVNYIGEDYTVVDIESIELWLSRYAMGAIANKEGTIVLRADTPKKMLEEITDFLHESKKSIDAIIEEYNNAEMRYPLLTLSHIIGRNGVETCIFLAHYNKAKIRNNRNFIDMKKISTLVLHYDAIVLICALDFIDAIKKSYKLMCSVQVKKRILEDITSELASNSSEATVGFMAYDNGHLQYTENTDEIKSQKQIFYSKQLDFVNSLETVDASDYIFKHTELQKTFSDVKFYCELGTLSASTELENFVMVTDDQFLFSIASLEEIPNIGLTSIIGELDVTPTEMVSMARKLCENNYESYLPLYLYRKIVGKIIEGEQQDEEGAKALIDFLKSDNINGEPTEYHRQLVMDLYRQYLQENGGEILISDPLGNIVFCHYFELNKDNILQTLFDESLMYSIEEDES